MKSEKVGAASELSNYLVYEAQKSGPKLQKLESLIHTEHHNAS